MRIIGGRYKGQRLLPPSKTGVAIRPTAERAREALFNILQHQSRLDGGRVADIFAGTGALGLEALSRGAGHVTFIESAPAATHIICQTLTRLDVTYTKAKGHKVNHDAPVPASVYLWDACSLSACFGAPYDLVFLDPPYAQGLIPPVLERLYQGGWVSPSGHIICEQDAREPDPYNDGEQGQEWTQHWREIRRQTYGRTRFIFLKASQFD